MSREVGPIQLLTFETSTPRFSGGIVSELSRLVANDTVRVLDALVLRKDQDGNVSPLRINSMSDLSPEAPGRIIADLIGLNPGSDSLDTAAAARVERQAELSGHPFGSEEDWDILDKIHNDSVAVLILLDHRWAIPFRDAVAAEGCMPLSDAWLDPRDLAAVGVIAAGPDGSD